jgi:hypothetical protein
MRSAQVSKERRIGTIGAGASLVMSAGLVVRLIAIGNEGVVVILIPAVIGAVAVLLTTRSWVYLAAAVLTSLTAMVSSFGGVGLLYVPSIVMFVWSASRESEADLVRDSMRSSR